MSDRSAMRTQRYLFEVAFGGALHATSPSVFGLFCNDPNIWARGETTLVIGVARCAAEFGCQSMRLTQWYMTVVVDE